MNDKAVDRIAQLGAAEADALNRVVEIHGEKYVFGDFKRIDPQDMRTSPIADTLTVHSLKGLTKYVTSKRDKVEGIVHVISPTRVEIISPVFGYQKQRETFVVASIDEDRHPFGQPQELDTFQVWLRSRFIPTKDSEDLLKMFGNVKDGTVKTAVDDGFSQELQVRAGASMTVGERPKNPVMLQPYRTFREVDQPQSEFIVRLTSNPSALPKVALYESDGGAWRLEAVSKIVAHLSEALPDWTVIG